MTNKREGLVDELRDILKKESAVRKKINLIDFAAEETKQSKIIGKYFVLKSDKNANYNSGYFHCIGYRDMRPVGTIITMYGSGKNKSITVELNHNSFEDWIENGKRMKPSLFKKFLKEALYMIRKELK